MPSPPNGKRFTNSLALGDAPAVVYPATHPGIRASSPCFPLLCRLDQVYAANYVRFDTICAAALKIDSCTIRQK